MIDRLQSKTVVIEDSLAWHERRIRMDFFLFFFQNEHIKGEKLDTASNWFAYWDLKCVYFSDLMCILFIRN